MRRQTRHPGDMSHSRIEEKHHTSSPMLILIERRCMATPVLNDLHRRSALGLLKQQEIKAQRRYELSKMNLSYFIIAVRRVERADVEGPKAKEAHIRVNLIGASR
jgi:hypothetical protein